MPLSRFEDDKPYWVAFSHLEHLFTQHFPCLRESFETLEKAWLASPAELSRAGLPKAAVEAILHVRVRVNVERVWDTTKRHGIRVLTLLDPSYPALLKEISAPPAVLFVRGTLPTKWDNALAVVGTRRPTSYGIQVASLLVGPIAEAGITIVSGLAFGIDAYAHRECLNAKGKTVAVLASGLDAPTPQSNVPLANEIVASGGALISEYPPGTASLPHHFPARNRIIAGLTRATLVIEGSRTSGSLITARYALEANRDVLTVPGPITGTMSSGPNSLLKMGATPITGPEDLMEALGINVTKPAEETPRAGSRPLDILLALLRREPLHIDELAERSTLTPSVVSAALSDLELRGKVENVGGRYVLKQ